MPPLLNKYATNTRLGKAALRLGVGAVIGMVGVKIASTAAKQLEISPAIAHQVQVADDIGGTLHIEPNDRPRAGESVLMWFALTRRGGTSLLLQECDCTVQVFVQPVADDAEAIASPKLEPVDAENYTGIPGASVTFPEIGAYTITISGVPLSANDFQPFELSFDITVVSR
ncbi:MAG: hypothetical protein AAGM36_08900 [Cyanobacteria bacterium J06597_1]